MVSLLVSALRCSMSGGEILARACPVPPAGPPQARQETVAMYAYG